MCLPYSGGIEREGAYLPICACVCVGIVNRPNAACPPYALRYSRVNESRKGRDHDGGNHIMNTHDLSRSQLDYLKCDYVSEVFHETVMYAGDMVDDATIHEYYDGPDFTWDDFGFGPKECLNYWFEREIRSSSA